MASNSMPARLVGLNGKTFETYVSKPAPVTLKKHARLFEGSGAAWGDIEITPWSPVIHFKLTKVVPAASAYDQDYATYAQVSEDEAKAVRVLYDKAVVAQQNEIVKLLKPAPQQPAKPSQPYSSWDPLSIADQTWPAIKYIVEEVPKVEPPKPAPTSEIPEPFVPKRRMMR